MPLAQDCRYKDLTIEEALANGDGLEHWGDVSRYEQIHDDLKASSGECRICHASSFTIDPKGEW